MAGVAWGGVGWCGVAWQRLDMANRGDDIQLSAVIASRDRPDDLVRCLGSLRQLRHLPMEAVVLDDGSKEPIEPMLQRYFDASYPIPWRCLRHDSSTGLIRARNELARAAHGNYLLSLDDDAYLLNAQGIQQAMTVLDHDASIAAVALAQADDAGQLLSDQPSAAQEPAFVRTFYGYGHLLAAMYFCNWVATVRCCTTTARSRSFANACSQRVIAWRFCQACVAHARNPHGRSYARITAHMWRNGCYSAVLNEPALRVMASIPARLAQFVEYRCAFVTCSIVRKRNGGAWRGSCVNWRATCRDCSMSAIRCRGTSSRVACAGATRADGVSTSRVRSL